MKILLLEDADYRIKWFLRRFAHEYVFVAKTAHDAIHALEQQTFDVIFLDHDLEIAHYDDYFNMSKENYLRHCKDHLDKFSGMAVATYLSENPQISPQAQIIIHTQNTVGAARMFATLNCSAQRSGTTSLRVARKLLERRVDVVPYNALITRRLSW